MKFTFGRQLVLAPSTKKWMTEMYPWFHAAILLIFQKVSIKVEVAYEYKLNIDIPRL